MAPIVSAAIGTNKYDWLSEEYLFLFLSAAASAAPGVGTSRARVTEPVCRIIIIMFLTRRKPLVAQKLLTMQRL